MSDGRISVNKRQSYSSVPDSVLEHPRLSFRARLTLAWLLGRPAGWEVRIGYMCRVLGLTDKTWPPTRDELIVEGFFSQQRFTDEKNRFTWRHLVTDSPLYKAIPPDGRDGAIPPAGRDGNGIHGSRGDIPPPKEQEEVHHHQGQGGGEVPPQWLEAVDLEIALESKQREVRNGPGLRRAILARYGREGGPSADVLEMLEKRKTAARDAEARQAARAAADAVATRAAANGPTLPPDSPWAKTIARARRARAEQ